MEQEAILAAFEGCDHIVVTNLLKLYLLELTDSLISSNYYDLIKSVHANYNGLAEKRITEHTSELPKPNIVILDLTRLVVIIGRTIVFVISTNCATRRSEGNSDSQN